MTGFLSATQARQTARDYTTVFTEINAIESAILGAINNNAYEVIVSNGTPMTATSGITSVEVTNGGSGYEAIVASASVSHPSGTNAEVTLTLTGGTITAVNVINGGSGYTPVNAVVSSVTRITNVDAAITLGQTGGIVDGYAIISAGQGYHVGNYLSISDGGPGVNATVVIASVGALGEILTLSIINGGSGYTSPVVDQVNRQTAIAASLVPVVTDGVITGITITNAGGAYHIGDEVIIVHPTGSSADIQVLTVDAAGAILTFSILNGGTNYGIVYATIVVNHPSGIGFSSTVLLSGSAVSSVVVDNGGVGYGPLLPTISVTDVTGSGAQFEIVLGGEVDDVITEVNVVSKGSNYTQAATLNVIPAPTSSGTNAVVVPTIESFGNAVGYYNAYKKITTSREMSDQIQYVIDYFTNLGYNIRLQTNPSTTNSLQWYIIW